MQNRKGLFADKGEPLLAYAVEGACKGTATIARVEECDNPLPKDTNIPNLGMENVENERCTKARLLSQATTLHSEPQGSVTFFSAWFRASGSGIRVYIFILIVQ